MAKKRPLVEDPPSASSSELEHVSSEEESEEEPTTVSSPPAKKLKSKSKSKSKTKVSVPDTESKKSKKKPKSDDGDGDAAAEDDVEAATPEAANADGGTERKLFQRVWSEEDEIVILQGMIDFAGKHGKYPTGDMEDFHDSIKKSIHFEGFSKTQLIDKVRRLRKKYRNNAAKSKYNPPKPHDQKSFLLSEKIWGEGGGRVSAPAKPKTVSISSGDLASKIELLKEFLSFLPKSIVERGLELMSESTKLELLSKLLALHIAECEIVAQRNKLLSEHAACILEALKNADEVVVV